MQFAGLCYYKLHAPTKKIRPKPIWKHLKFVEQPKPKYSRNKLQHLIT